ncbi:hypothetical protein J7E93_08305 [Streptomyces sp. ISL-36]|uniref:hypothetical protein n=1 Tax=Streptomyces sp. ISL-36 TaxID=2819182 RepID=UPI001BE5520C|nr:hypothetical protein [Streptomyces sp. ISL-36]MBT2440117.1 hypothetical protein [Streptomyces sp. ISL-36]
MKRKAPLHFSGFWLPTGYFGDVPEDSGDEVDAIIRAALADLHAGVAEGDPHRSVAARDGLARALARLEFPDRRLVWVLCHLAQVHLTWPGDADPRSSLDLAVQYGDAAAEQVLDDVTDREFVVVTAAHARWGRYLLTHDGEDILAAAEYLERIPTVPPDDTVVAGIVARVHLSLYEHTSDVGDLDMAMAISRRVIGPERTMAIGFEELDLVANVLEGLYAQRREPGLLVEAVRLGERALLFAHTADERCIGLAHLADYRRALYWLGGDTADLEQAIQAASEATQLCPRSVLRGEAAQLSLALGLRARFEAFGKLNDLNEAIRLFRSVRPTTAKLYSYELSVALRLRYEAIGSYPDLGEALQLSEPNARCDYASSNELVHYATLLQLAFEHTGDASDLATSIRIARRAVAKTRHGQVSAELAYHTLATCLLKAHRAERGTGLLDEAVESIEEALTLAAPDAPTTTTIQINRATAYRMRWEEHGSPDDLDVAMGAATDVLTRTEADHPDRAGRLCVYAVIADAFGRVLQDPSARVSALDAWDEATRSIVAPPDTRIRAAVAAGQSLADDGRWEEANDRFATAVSLMPEVAWHGLDRSSQEHRLREGADLPALAAAHALQVDDTSGAITRLEVGRSVMWQHLLRLNDLSAVSGDPEVGEIVAELRRAVEVEELFRGWLSSEGAADQMPREQVEELAAGLGHLKEPRAAAVVLGTLALRLRGSDVSAAVAAHLDAIEFAEAAGDYVHLGRLHGNLGYAYRQIDDEERGIRHYRRSAEILEGSAPAGVVGHARNNLGLALASTGRYGEAAAELAAAAAHFAGVDRRRQATALLDLAVTLTHLDRLDDAMVAVQQARELFVELGDRPGPAHAWYNERG